ncbi:alpha/beta fold hydrolase [Neobacillus jeddahensis]|uniref:alpha/beta fold hydrolase n=1 Tax=Neobacillus jeddahensis TaxID=1461580 RepID=UPI000590076A|nr:alpha/beta fold hydrolase [Neobacillus jeddahensis]
MPTFTSNGIQLHYVDEGKGTPLLHIHGLAASVTMFKNEIAHFKENFRVLAVDLRGHGKSDKPLEYRLEDHVQDVMNLLKYLKIERVSILGSSMGSYVAQGIATQRPELVDKLILVVAKAHGEISSSQEMVARFAEELRGLTEEEQQQFLFTRSFHNIPALLKAMEDAGPDEIQLTPAQLAAANKALEGFDFRPKLGEVTADTLIISGRYDGLNPPERGMEIAALIPQASFIEFTNSGHAPQVEEPELFLKSVTDFLQK